MLQLKQYVKAKIAAGASFKEVREELIQELVSEALILTHGNQTKVAEVLKMNRTTVTKYARR